MLRISELKKSYDKTVLSSFSYEFPDTGLFFLRGESGRGKTTLLRLIGGLEKPDGGIIETEENVRFSLVFQEARLVPHLSLLENLYLVGKRDKERALAILSRLHLDQAAHKKPATLSGGMRQRAAIARSLYYGGNVYLWDEPTGELDPENTRLVNEILLELARDALVICVTHDLALGGGTEIRLD